MSLARSATPETLVRERPEWAPWLALVDEARGAFDDPLWARAVPARAPEATPLIDGAVLRVDAAGAGGFVRRLFTRAAAAGGATTDALGAAARGGALDALALLETAVRQDLAGLDAVAAALRVDAHSLGAVAGIAVTPLLHACRRAWAAHVPTDWSRGHCPVCGGWPTLAEARGLERSRRLRCGRCGGDWHSERLRCVFCDNVDHTRLGSLVPASTRDTRSVEACEACRGYLKTLTVLQATAPDALPLVDLASVELDIVALQQGYARPSAPACRLDTRVLAA